MTRLAVLDSTVQKTHEWLRDIKEGLGLDDDEAAYAALGAVMHGLRDLLNTDHVALFGAQLPMLVRGFYYEGWRPGSRPSKYRHKEEFLQHVSELYRGLEEPEREQAVRAVFTLLAGHVTGGELKHVRDQLPPELRALWYAPF